MGIIKDTCGKCLLICQSLPRKPPLFIFKHLYKERLYLILKALCLLLRGYMLKPQLGSEKWVSPEKVLFLYAMALHADTRQLFLPLLCSQLRTEVPFKTHCVRAYLWNLGSCKSGCFRCPMLHHWLPSQVVALRCHLFFFFFLSDWTLENSDAFWVCVF